MAAAPPAVELSRVSKRFGTRWAVRDLDWTVPTGAICGVLGPNGAGKTTTIRMLMSIIYPDEGEVRLLGGSALDAKQRIGYMPEERGVYRKMGVGEFLSYIGRLKGVPAAGLRRRIETWLERVELAGMFRRRCEELSKGMQQKVQFLAAVLHEPDLLILDEPFSGLDPVNAVLLGELIEEQHRRGATILFSTHVLHQAEEICDRAMLIDRGRKLLDAPLAEIRRRFDPRSLEAQPLGAWRIDPAALDGVLAVESGEEGRLELILEEGADPQALMARLLATQPLRLLRLRQLSLQEVFVRLVTTGRAAADHALPGGEDRS